MEYTDQQILKMAKNRRLKQQASDLFEAAKDARARFDWEWLTRDLYRRGYQFSRFNQSTRTMTLSTKSRAKIAINLTNAQMRIIRNQVVAFRPKWETMPVGKSEQAKANARYSNKLLDYYYEKFGLRNSIKKTITQGLTYSVGGPWQIGYDPDADNGRGEVFIWEHDTYDFFVDPKCTDAALETAEYCGKAVRTPLDAIKTNPEYEFTDNLEHGESKLAESEYKQFLLQALNYQQGSKNTEDEGLILKEMWIKTRVSEKNIKEIKEELRDNDQDVDKLNIGEVVMRVVTFVDILQDPLKVQTFRRSDFPFVLYEGDIEPTSLYGESWIKHVIPMNRVLNDLESSTFEFNYRMAKGRMAVQRNSGTRIIANQHGDIVEYNPGTNPPTPIPIASLPNTYQIQIENMRRYIEDIGGAHDVSMGRIPSGVKSGVGIAELKSADATNQQDLVDNLQDFLVVVAKKLLKEIAQNYDVPKIVRALGKGGSADLFAVVGAKGAKRRKKTEVKIGEDVFDLAVIGDENEIRVSIGSWLAYTKSAQQEKLMEMYTAGIIDQQTFLEFAEFAEVEDIVDRSRKDKLLEKLRATPAQPGMPSDEEIAEQENYMMAYEGKVPEAEAQDNHQVHILIHQEQLGAADNPILEAHIRQHMQFLEQGVSDNVNRLTSPQVAPQQMPEMSPETMQPEASMGQAQQLPEEQALMEVLQGMQ